MNNSGIYSMVIMVLILNACSKSNQPPSSSDYLDLARQKYGIDVDYFCLENANKKLVLCKYQTSNTDMSIKSWNFFVYEIEKKEYLFEESIDKGGVKWYSETAIEVTKTPGTMTRDETMLDYAWIIDVFTGKKTKKSEYLRKKTL